MMNFNKSVISNKSNLKKFSKKSLTNENNTSFISKKKSSIDLKQTYLLDHYSKLKEIFGELNSDEIKSLYKKFSKLLVLIDSFCFIADLIVVTWLYFNHFEYNKHGYKLNKSDKIQRWICAGLTFLVILALIVRYKIHKYYQNLKFILSLRATIPSQNIKVWKLLIEILCHIILPYPGLNYNFQVYVLGVKVNYSLDMILFTISIIRLYVIFKIIKIYNTYTNSRGQKLNSFFGNKDIWMFLYRTNLKNNGFITVAFIFLIIAFACSYVFKVFENYQMDETSTEFGYFFNCLWLLVQSIATIGYGDLVPNTIIGRIILAFVCMMGVFIQSLFTVSMLMFIFFY